jgi:hypothetical protein
VIRASETVTEELNIFRTLVMLVFGVAWHR